MPCVGDVALEKAAGMIDIWLPGLVVCLSPRVREVPGSLPGAALDDHQTFILLGKHHRSPGHWPRKLKGAGWGRAVVQNAASVFVVFAYSDAGRRKKTVNQMIVQEWLPTLPSITVFTASCTNLSPFIKDCREWDTARCISDLLGGVQPQSLWSWV